MHAALATIASGLSLAEGGSQASVADGRSYLTIGMTNPRNHVAAAEAARVLGRHFEAPVIRHEDPKDLTRFADRKQGQPPRHAFGREKRSRAL